jgi:xanthine dehydrogenase small subunit
VVIGELAEGGRVRLRAVNACIAFLPMLDGKVMFTVESLKGSAGRLHPVQRAMVDCHGSQCGFCTPGFVMSLFALFKNRAAPTRAAIDDALSGNLCRCTGYRPIIEAATRMYALAEGEGDGDWLRRPATACEAQSDAAERALAARLAGLRRSDALAIDGPHGRFDAPRTLADFAALRAVHPQAQILAGGTDVGLWVTKELRPLPHLIYSGEVEELKRIRQAEGWLDIGAAVSLADACAALDAQYPELARLWRRFASVPVRNAATLVGNIANGSPIGDSMPALIALGARLVLRHGEQCRELALEAFYRGYRDTALAAGEFVESVRVPLPRAGRLVRSYKVAKRFDQDISAVCAGFAVDVADGTVSEARLAYGGMAPVPRRATVAEAALNGRPWNEATVQGAIAALAGDFAPLSDLRGSAAYRMKLAQNLLWRLWLEARPLAPLAPAEFDVFSLGGD